LRVQIRFFGSLAYRVRLRGLGFQGQRYIYSHILTSDEEETALAEDQQPESEGPTNRRPG
jgi:hypothetical protein